MTLTFDELIPKLAGFTPIVDMRNDRFRLHTHGGEVPQDVLDTLLDWKSNHPEQREMLMEYVYQRGKPAPIVPEDTYRCPGCPHRGMGVLFEMGEWQILCDSRCPEQEVSVEL